MNNELTRPPGGSANPNPSRTYPRRRLTCALACALACVAACSAPEPAPPPPRYEPVLGLLSAVASAPAPRELAADAERLRVFTALADVLATLGKDRPLLLVIDDLQWADDLSLAFIEWLGQHALGQSRVLLLGTYRSEEMEDALASALSAHPDASLRLARLSAPRGRKGGAK